ncbi:sugar phosphate nucleotidyltransferase [Novosphingobium sp. ZW T3_23]|uniref:sugar phosphate nucleotidyltransferase n=1 Tax=Novosphingobium sp. ZW T3_23 TaxID=3378084 RepID=UPI0038553487
MSSEGHPGSVLSIILAGGRGSRLHDLTDHEAKPALPIGPHGRLIDFTLANAVNSGLGETMVLTQYQPDTLQRHLLDCWQADDARPAISILDGAEYGPYEGTAAAVACIADEIDLVAPRHVVILAGDHLYQMDYRPFVERHVASGAEVTVGVVHVPREQASGFGVLEADASHRVTGFVEKPFIAPEAPDCPGHALASMGIYVFEWKLLRELLKEVEGTVADLDFGKHIIPALVSCGTAYAYALPGRQGREPLWQDLGTLDAYHAVQRHLLDGSLPLDPSWPVDHPVHHGLGDRRAIGFGSTLRNVVLLPGARIGRAVTISDAIVLADAVVPDGFDLDAELAEYGKWCTVSEGGIRVISARALQRLASRRRRPVEPARYPDRYQDTGARARVAQAPVPVSSF